jgi:hypothetical protein
MTSVSPRDLSPLGTGSHGPVACPGEVVTAAAGVIECQLAPYPVKYLGIPLAIRRLPSEANQPLAG